MFKMSYYAEPEYIWGKQDMKQYRVFIKPVNYIAVTVNADSPEDAENYVAENMSDFYEQIRNVDINDLELEVQFGEACLENEVS